MGERANVVFTNDEVNTNGTLKDNLPNTFSLYLHWGGYGLKKNLAVALMAARRRWNDPAYGRRIVVSRLIGDDWSSETGYGLNINDISDNEYPVLVVDFENLKVYQFGNDDEYLSPEAALNEAVSRVWSFDEFVNENFLALEEAE